MNFSDEDPFYFWAKTNSDGKPGISVFEHMVNVGIVAKCISEIYPELLGNFRIRSEEIGALAALHDIGKIAPGFQMKCKAWLEETGLLQTATKGCWDTMAESDHGKISHAVIHDFLLQKGVSRNVAKYLAAILGSHHGRLKLPYDRGVRLSAINNRINEINWSEERFSNATRIWDAFNAESSLLNFTSESPSIWWLAGLTSVADWIGSDERFFSSEKNIKESNISEKASNALEAIGFSIPLLKEKLSFQEIFEFSPNDMQAKTLEIITKPGVYVIEAPMGMGKTEAALGAAYQLMVSGLANGIYFALPTQATSNRIHIRMDEFLERISIEPAKSRLIHGNSWLLQAGDELSFSPNGKNEKRTEDARAGIDWFASSKRALIAPFGVGTIDQALLGVVAAKHFFVRHFALAGKVVILDEIHSYDLYTGTLIDKLIKTLEGLGCTVIILSATLTAKRRRKLVSSDTCAGFDGYEPYPLITGQADGQSIQPLASVPPAPRKIKIEFLAQERAFEEAVKLAVSGGSILWICSTVGSAQEQYRHIKDLSGGRFPVGLLHSRFPFWKRDEIENEWMVRFGKTGENRCGSILVSTQIVEQSVDLDADLVITELAPTDMLLQRLGRLWRHERGKRPIDQPRVCIIEEADSLENLRLMEPSKIKESLGTKANVYAPYILLRSLEVWKKQINGIEIPSRIRDLIESTYEEIDNDPESWMKLYDEWFGVNLAKSMKADLNSNHWMPPLNDQEGVQTRLNEMKTVSMVLCKYIGGKEAVFIEGTRLFLDGEKYCLNAARTIHRNIVKIPEHIFEKGRMESCQLFEEYVFENQCAGIIDVDGSIKVNGLKKGISLFYSDEMGLVIDK